MKEKKTQKIDFSSKRLGDLADKFYNEGDFLSSLRFAYKQLDIYGGDGDVYVRLSDIYESMDLHGSAVNWWFRFLHIAEIEDLPDIYEGLAVNFLTMGNESQSAYYYNKLIDVDETLPDETKIEIANAFSKAKKDNFKFVYPPRLADYSKEVSIGSKALKHGDCKRAITEFSKVEKGSKEYLSAKEMQSVAHLLAGETTEAESVCLELLKDEPDDVRILSTLAAVYLEQGRKDESREIALKLAAQTQTDTDALYKVATVCCENGLHEQAYLKFSQLDKKISFDGRMLYFKGVSAYKSGRIDEAEQALDELCTIYPDAEVAKYYLKAIRRAKENPDEKDLELTYFYHIPQEERESRCRTLIHIKNCPKDEASLFGLVALHDGYFKWCFDEMDGNDHDLQYLGLLTAVHVRADEFIQDVLLDYDVSDFLKIETLYMLLNRNEDADFSVVLCNIYKKVSLLRIKLGRKKRKRFLESYAKVASRFVAVNESYAKKLKQAAEELYRSLERYEALDMIENTDDCACAIFVLSGLKELGKDAENVASAFGANPEKVGALAAMALSAQYGLDKNGILQNEKEIKDETD